jgi:hypothetical protein
VASSTTWMYVSLEGELNHMINHMYSLVFLNALLAFPLEILDCACL